jgi:hypothetical protein
MLTNYDIEDICKSLQLPLVGVFSKDELPKRHYIGSYYINMENSDEGNGTHWIFCKINDDGKALYFDSFGIYPPENIDTFLTMFKPFMRSNRQIQDIRSESCGKFCLMCDNYINDELKLGNDLEDAFEKFLTVWSDDTKKNDRILNEMMKKLL